MRRLGEGWRGVREDGRKGGRMERRPHGRTVGGMGNRSVPLLPTQEERDARRKEMSAWLREEFWNTVKGKPSPAWERKSVDS